MEISAEVKAIVIAPYLGQKVFLWSTEPPLRPDWLDRKKLEVEDGDILLLRPLSAISDEDADDVARIGCTHGRWIKEQIQKGHEWRLRGEMVDVLRSKGYDCRHGLLGGKTLKEAGLAVYEVAQSA